MARTPLTFLGYIPMATLFVIGGAAHAQQFVPVSISGVVYNDLNGDGLRGVGELGLQGWTVNVVDQSNTVVSSGISGLDGSYLISGIGEGNFTLQEAVQPGWSITYPTNPDFYSFTTSSGVNIVGGLFGNHFTGMAVPEPGTYALLGSWGLLGTVLLRRRRARK